MSSPGTATKRSLAFGLSPGPIKTPAAHTGVLGPRFSCRRQYAGCGATWMGVATTSAQDMHHQEQCHG